MEYLLVFVDKNQNTLGKFFCSLACLEIILPKLLDNPVAGKDAISRIVCDSMPCLSFVDDQEPSPFHIINVGLIKNFIQDDRKF